MIWDMISPSIALFHALSHRIATKHLVVAYVLLWLLVSALILTGLPPGLFCRPSAANPMNTSQD